MQKILIIQTAFIGDVVLATGILEKLHKFFPDARIDFLLRKGNEGLLRNHPFLNQLIIWDKKAGKFRDLMRILKLIRIEKYDRVINVQRFAATGFLTTFSGARETRGYDKNPFSRFFTKSIPHIVSVANKYKHEIDRCNDLIKDITDEKAFLPKLHPSTADFSEVESLKSEPYIVIAPASVWFTKQYPVEKWISFIKRLPPGLKIYLIGAPSDQLLAQQIIENVRNPDLVSLCGKLDFLKSAALMKDALMNYVNDSAPMHFASSVNAPLTAIYCSTMPWFGFGPLSENSTIIQTTEQLSCRPCGLHGHKACPEGHFKCALTITDEQLLSPMRRQQS
ncbi:glycosyltransferase family 9 protein [Flavihumibacter sp. ZG627]|uniref:glycosyltransferase family 9 protein n=1 Tax=Flavihumibacter sp. ZG627 TaxID=1463156 RepID=UPI00057FD46A|nr:glycosyltransferase family 9 protein [Flavihumibacter sp. ZG627]KIC91475.1 heptosyltransferase [Flavihumibacter sp. ZG627]